MKFLRKSADRGSANFGWLKALHTFSFGHYYDPRFMGFSSLRVINEDRVSAGRGFPPHSHQDMEIITFILDGTLEHKDSLGNGSQIGVGEIQYMSAGTGVEHSEYNPSLNQETHLLQIWIEPHTNRLAPTYAQRNFVKDLQKNKLLLLCSPSGEDSSIAIRQDAKLFYGKFEAQAQFDLPALGHRGYWIHLIKGSLIVDEIHLEAGDSIGIEQAEKIHFQFSDSSEFLLFDLP